MIKSPPITEIWASLLLIRRWRKCWPKPRRITLSKRKKAYLNTSRKWIWFLFLPSTTTKVAVIFRDIICIPALGSLQHHGWECRRGGKLWRPKNSAIRRYLEASVFDWYVQLLANSITSSANFEKVSSPLLRGGSASYHGSSLQHQAEWRQVFSKLCKEMGTVVIQVPGCTSHKFIVGLCKRNLKAEVRSLIVGIRTKMIAQLIEAIAEAEEFSQNSKMILRW